MILEFVMSVCCTLLGAVLFVYVYPYIDYFFYTKLKIVLDCDGCHPMLNALFFLVIPFSTASGLYLLNRFYFKTCEVLSAVLAFFCSAMLGGGLSLLMLQFLGGAEAATAILFVLATASTAGYHVPVGVKTR